MRALSVQQGHYRRLALRDADLGLEPGMLTETSAENNVAHLTVRLLGAALTGEPR
ncbi:hypothetical protein ACFYN3_37440 [Streptomyces lavendulae]|uniref:hypothetical protein n=1 Tax=Streptomyces lavendulae TaxID=1914 RepID=UPI0033DA347D